MCNRFKNGYTCKVCAEKAMSGRFGVHHHIMTPLYFRIDKKFVFAGLVKCNNHGITEAIALRKL